MQCSNVWRPKAAFWLIWMLCACVPVIEAPELDDYAKSYALIDQGVLHLRAHDLERAEASFSLSKELNDSPQAWDGLGSVAFLRGDLVAAERAFIAAHQRDGSYGRALGHLALLYEAAGRLPAAAKLFEEGIRVNPDDARLRSNFGVFSIEHAGDVLLGRAELMKAQALLSHPIINHNVEVIESSHGSS